jgi:hypothetical protein
LAYLSNTTNWVSNNIKVLIAPPKTLSMRNSPINYNSNKKVD